jgi:hypothetical protein
VVNKIGGGEITKINNSAGQEGQLRNIIRTLGRDILEDGGNNMRHVMREEQSMPSGTGRRFSET